MQTTTKIQQKQRIRAKISGTGSRPRLVASISNRHIVAQLIDDTKGQTLAYASTQTAEVSGSMVKKAELVGARIAEAAKKAKIKTVVFDRGGRIYAQRLNALATAARKGGLEF